MTTWTWAGGISPSACPRPTNNIALSRTRSPSAQRPERRQDRVGHRSPAARESFINVAVGGGYEKNAIQAVITVIAYLSAENDTTFPSTSSNNATAAAFAVGAR